MQRLFQVTDALIFLHNLHFLHCAISSHAVQLVNTHTAKLGQFEFLTNFRQTEGQSQLLLKRRKCRGLMNWLSPEVICGDAASKVSDIYSLCCVVFELITGVYFLLFTAFVIFYIVQAEFPGTQYVKTRSRSPGQ